MRAVIPLTALVLIAGWIAHAGFVSALATPAAYSVAADASQPPREIIGRISPPANTEGSASPRPSLTGSQRITQLETSLLPANTPASQKYRARFHSRPAAN